MKNQIQGCVKINAEGKNLYSFINRLHTQKIAVFRQYIKGGRLSAEIYRHNLADVEIIAEESGVKLSHFEYNTLSKHIISRRRRFGFILGVILFLGASLYFSNVIVTIDIEGNETVSDSIILSALSEIGIDEGTPFGQINYIWSENQLRLMVDKIAWAGMHRTGHRLVVEVTEIVEKPDMLLDRIPCNVVSAHDAEIVEITVLDGQLMHIIGDYVFEGDMLINGVTTDFNGNTTLHHAMGEIIGKYSESVDFNGSFEKERMNSTGKSDKRRKLHLFNLEIPLYFGKNNYDYSENTYMEKPLYLFGKKLPISLHTTEYHELRRNVTTLSEEELRMELMEKVYLYEKNFLNDCEIIERNITETITESEMNLSVCYKLKGNICRQREILVK